MARSVPSPSGHPYSTLPYLTLADPTLPYPTLTHLPCNRDADVHHRGVPLDHDEPSPAEGTHAAVGDPAGGERRGHYGQARPQESGFLRSQLREHLRRLAGQAKAPRERI